MAPPAPTTLTERSQATATGLSKRAIDRLASGIAEKLELEPGAPLEPVVARLGGEVRPAPQNSKSEPGSGSITVHPGQGFTIQLSSYAGPYRQHFTIAHELGHYFLHAEAGAKHISIERFGSNRVEWEANWFAAGFLLPEEQFVEAWTGTAGCIPLLVSEFKVSPGVIEIRRDTLRSWGREI